MTNAIAKTNGTALAVHDLDPFEAYANAVSPRSIVGELLKFSKGDFIAGEDGRDIKAGTVFTANLDELMAGYIKWENAKPVEHRMVRVADGVTPPTRSTLGDTDESKWEKDDRGEPRDPWQFTNYLPLMSTEGDLFTFVTSSRGGIGAVGQLARTYARHRRNSPNVHPLITLDVGSYEHSNKAFGKIKFPQFNPVGWELKEGFNKALTAAGYSVAEPPPAEKDPADEMSDDIPF
jgi:hypothetical protein